MARKYTIDAEIEVLTAEEAAYPLVRIEFSHVAGASDYYNKSHGGWEPGWSPETEVISATLITGDGLTPSQTEVDNWATKWLDGVGFDLAIEEVDRCNQPPED